MLYDGCIIDNTYKILGEIGSGGMGVVFLAYHLRLEKYVVLKKFKGDYKDISLLRNEVDILKSLHHMYLPQVYDFIQVGYDIYTIIDYISGCDLSTYVKNNYAFTESQLIKWFRQLCQVLQYLHSQRPPILHTDIKPANIIVTESGNICLIDFGISLGGDTGIKGLSLNYSSPEQYENYLSITSGTASRHRLDGRTDIYSLGASFYYLMTGCVPDIRNPRQPEISSFSLPYSDAFISIVGKAMERDIDKRFKSAEKLSEAIDNIKKQDKRYKNYVLLQVVSSIIAGIIILFGIGLVVYGSDLNLRDEYNERYESFVQSYNVGKTEDAINTGREIINSSKYNSLLKDDLKAQILHAMGECYYLNGDYTNAGLYYGKALEYADFVPNPEDCYLDYIMLLAEEGRYDEARGIIDEVNEKRPGLIKSGVVDAVIYYHQGKYDNALGALDGVELDSLDESERCEIYTLYGDIYSKMQDYENAADFYQKALQQEENALNLRKLAVACMNTYESGPSVRKNDFLDIAERTYQKINTAYYPTAEDSINLAVIYSYKGNYPKAIDLLESQTNIYPEDYRLYMFMAFFGDESKNERTAEFCQKARELYKYGGHSDKAQENGTDIERLRMLYQKYCGSAW